MSVLRSLFLTVVAALAFTGAALAQDGLQRFERDLKPQLEFEKFTYSSGTSLGISGFVLNDVVAVIPANAQTGDKASTVKVQKITVEEFDFANLPNPKDPNDDKMPNFARLKFEGIVADDELHAMMAAYGIPKVPVDAALDYRLDEAAKTMTLNKLELSLRGLGRTELSLVLDNVSNKPSKLDTAKDDARVRAASLVIDDTGLLAILLPAIAKANGATAEVWVAMAQVPLVGYATNQGAATMKALDAIASFVKDWKAPKGPIRLTIKPPATTGMDDLDKVLEPNGLTDVLGLTVDYAGTRPGAAMGR